MANIRWMYRNKLENMTVTDVGADASSGYSTDYVADFDLSTAWRGTSAASGSGTVALAFAAGSAIFADTLVVVGNFADFLSYGTVTLHYGHVYPIYEGTLSIPINSAGTIVNFFGNVGSYTYWRLRMGRPFSDGTYWEVKEAFLGKYLELDDNPVYPYGMARQENISVTETKKGVRHSYHNFTRKAYSLNYEGITDTDKESIESMLDTCGGGYKSLWYCEDPTNHPEETMFVRFAAETYTFQEVISGVWNVTLPIEEEL